MALFLEFAAQQWILIAALLAVIGKLFLHESRKAGPALSPQQAINLVNNGGGVFVDVRDAAAFKKGHIVDALHIPMSKLKEQKTQLEHYRDKPIILVCNMGQEAGAAGKQLKADGFSQVYKMAGGMIEWNNLQLPTVSK
ncbi:MAG: rhodanese-like domain-containing protein [Anaerolineae bacterium]